MNTTKAIITAISISVILASNSPFINCQNPKQDTVAGIPVNYDESLSGSYTLPDPLMFPNGKIVKNAGQWAKKRRPQILKLFEEFQFGKVPDPPGKLSYKVFDPGTKALNGTAIRKQVTIFFSADTSGHKMDILIYIPANADKPVPLFFNVGFSPNASMVDDPGIKEGFIRGRDGKLIPAQRKSPFGILDPGLFLSQGIGFATV